MTKGILYFGGSFNPIHLGHIGCARFVAHSQNYSRVILIPSAQPPHKPTDPSLASANDRLEMCRIIAAEDPLFSVDDLELCRPGPSYTLDTVHELKSRGPTEIHWMIGADMLRYLPKWHESIKLMQEVFFVIVARPGWDFDWNTMPPQFRHLEQNVVTAPLVDITATEIRRRCKAGESIEGLVAPAIARYIIASGLYR